MGRYIFVVTLAAAAALSPTCTLYAQGQPSARHRSPQGGFFRMPGNPNHGISPGMNPGRERFNQLTPEERQVFQRNAERWLQMTPEQRRVFREREVARRAQL